MEAALTALLNDIVLWIPKIAASLLICGAFWCAGALVKQIIQRLAKNSTVNQDLFHLIERISIGALLVFGTMTALGTLGIDISALVAGLGITGFAMGFALRDIISNLLAGALVMIYQPFRRNDEISVAGFEGTVIKIDLRYTTLKAKDKIVLIPNSFLLKNTICIQGEAEKIIKILK